MYFTYILYSSRVEKYYTGQTKHLNKRLEEHNRGKTAYMKSGLPWELVFSREFQDRGEAMKLEKYIKKRGAVRFLKDIKDQSGYRIPQGGRVVPTSVGSPRHKTERE